MNTTMKYALMTETCNGRTLVNRNGLNRVVMANCPEIWNPFTRSMNRNNTFLPGIERIIYNLKTQTTRAKRDEAGNLVIDPSTQKPVRETIALDRPVLSTVVYFKDNSKVSVVNSINDKIDLEDVKINRDGVEVVVHTASDSAKEAGFVYAIAKRLFGKSEVIRGRDGNLVETGNIEGDGFGRKLRDLIADRGYDSIIEEKVRTAVKAKNVTEHAAKAEAAKNKPKHVSQKEMIQNLTEAVMLLRKQLEENGQKPNA